MVKYKSATYGDGFLTTGHVSFEVGDAIKYNGITVGYVEEMYHDGYDDTAFVSFANNYSWDGTITNLAEEFSRDRIPIENNTVKLRGYQSDPYVQGEVTDASYDYYGSSDGIIWFDMLQIDHGTEHGDSGGACIFGVTDTGRTSLICGAISQGNSQRTLVVKSTNIHYY